jgi:hypothetical protein
MQGLRLSDPKERQRYLKSHLNGNVVRHRGPGGKRISISARLRASSPWHSLRSRSLALRLAVTTLAAR